MDITAGCSVSFWGRRPANTGTVQGMVRNKMKKHCNTLFFKIIITVLGAIFCLTAALSILNIKASQNAFVENFVESQEKIFRQIDENIYDFFRDITSITQRVSTSSAVKAYLTKENWENVDESKNILDMKRYIKQLPISKYSELSMVLVGKTGKTHNYNNTSRLILTGEELLESSIVQKALKNPKKLICQYGESGYTDVMKNYPVIMMAKAITSDGGKSIEGVTLLTIKEEDFRNFYDGFITSSNDLLIFNQESEIISSNRPEYLRLGKETEGIRKILKEMRENQVHTVSRQENGRMTGYMMQRLQNSNYTVMGVIHPEQAFESVYDFRYIIEITVIITAVTGFILFLLVRQLTRPLSNLAQNMGRVQGGRLDRLVKVEGTTEIRELSATYNEMLCELENYIEKLMQVEKAKREAEIHSLQMQINPHYIYNTLASVKWLIWQGDKEKSVQVIDAFIQLLRNTISNKNEFITLKEEIENLKNYVLINQIRYGNQVNVEFYVMPDCDEQKIPKLILQPFVENAFFHAFPQGEQGTISIFARQSDHLLKVEIEDNGIGMSSQTLRGLLDKKNAPAEHFTGIGVNNVDDRMKLIYGESYGILVESQERKGTKITICFPLE